MSDFDTVVARVTDRLLERHIPFRLIGAAALAAHGVARSTRDVDLLAADPAVLDASLWEGAVPEGFVVDVRHGDATDPLLGVVRIEEELPDDAGWDQAPDQLDIVVVRGRWAASLVASAGPEVHVSGTAIRSVDEADLVLLKLYAGGPRDGWDIAALLDATADRSTLVARVDDRVAALPKRCRRMWERIREA